MDDLHPSAEKCNPRKSVTRINPSKKLSVADIRKRQKTFFIQLSLQTHKWRNASGTLIKIYLENGNFVSSQAYGLYPLTLRMAGYYATMKPCCVLPPARLDGRSTYISSAAASRASKLKILSTTTACKMLRRLLIIHTCLTHPILKSCYLLLVMPHCIQATYNQPRSVFL